MDNTEIREELQLLLLRESHGPQPSNYIDNHAFMTHEHRAFLVQSINSAAHGLGYELTTAAVAVSILDRFTATQYIKTSDCGAMPLAAISCLSLAAKYEEVGVASDIHALQAHTPWLGPHTARDIAQMEMLVMKVVDWRLGCLTAASFLDQLLCDALSGALFHLQQQPGDYLSTARQLAAKLVSHTMPGEFNLQFAPSTQACAAIVVAFQALKVNQQALLYLMEEWTQLGIPQILACANILLGHIEPADDTSSPCASSNSSQSANHNSVCHSSPFNTASVDGGTSHQDAIQSALQFQSAQEVAEAPLPGHFFSLETATSLSSVNTAA